VNRLRELGAGAEIWWWLGVGLIALGVGLIYPPLSPIAVGAACILVAVGLVRRVE